MPESLAKNRIILINPLYGSVGYSPPLSLAYIAALLEKNGHAVKIIDQVAVKYQNGELSNCEVDQLTKKAILEFGPQIIGIGAMTAQFNNLKHLAKLIRKLTRGGDYFLIAGGIHPTVEPELTLKECPELDAVCRGEGEFALLELASGIAPEKVAGLTLRQGANPDRPMLKDLDQLPFPARHLLDMNFYTRLNDMITPNFLCRAATLFTSRGCIDNCKFCCNRFFFRTVRSHSPEYVLNELNSIINNYRVDTLSFLDSMFLFDRKRVETLCQKLIESKFKLRWACCARADAVNEKNLALMKRAGCVYINFGFESGSQKMLDAMNKRTTVSQNYKAAELTNQAGILVTSALITNLPGETQEDMLANIRFLKNTKLFCASLNNLLPLPGSPYYKELLAKGVITYSDKTWQEIGALTESIEKTPIYSDLPRDKFLELYRQTNRIINLNNDKNYIRLNWHKAPFQCLKKLILLALTGNPFIHSLAKRIQKNIKRIASGLANQGKRKNDSPV